MAKSTIQYVCSSCGAKAPQMIGRCPVCGEWGTYEEEIIQRGGPSGQRSFSEHSLSGAAGQPKRLQDVAATNEMRLDMRNGEFNRVLGGGLVPGSLVLLGGEPGIGKSTLALQVLMQQGERKTFYASGDQVTRRTDCRQRGKPLYLFGDFVGAHSGSSQRLGARDSGDRLDPNDWYRGS